MSDIKVLDYTTLNKVLDPLRKSVRTVETGIPAVDQALFYQSATLVDALEKSLLTLTKDPVGDLVNDVNERAGTPLLSDSLAGWPGVPDHITGQELINVFRALLFKDVTIGSRKEYREEFLKCHEQHAQQAQLVVTKNGVDYVTRYTSSIGAHSGYYTRGLGRVTWYMYWHPASLTASWEEPADEGISVVMGTYSFETLRERQKAGFGQIGHVNQEDQVFRLPETLIHPDPYTERFLLRVTRNEYAALLCCFALEDWDVEESPHGYRAFYVEQKPDEDDPDMGWVTFTEAELDVNGEVTDGRGMRIGMSLNNYRSIFFGDGRRYGHQIRKPLFYEWVCPETGRRKPRPM